MCIVLFTVYGSVDTVLYIGNKLSCDLVYWQHVYLAILHTGNTDAELFNVVLNMPQGAMLAHNAAINRTDSHMSIVYVAT